MVTSVGDGEGNGPDSVHGNQDMGVVDDGYAQKAGVDVKCAKMLTERPSVLQNVAVNVKGILHCDAENIATKEEDDVNVKRGP